MIKSVNINNNVNFRAFNNVKNGHANKNISNSVVKNEKIEVKEKPLLLASFIQPQKQISFKSAVFDSVPDDWVVQNGGIVSKGGVEPKNNFVDFDNESLKPSFPKAKDLFASEESKGKVFPFYHVKYSDGKKVPMQNGFVYSNSNGQITKIDYSFGINSEKFFDSEKAIDLSDSKYIPTQKQLATLVEFYDKADEKELRNELLEKNMFETPQIQDIHARYLVEDGRYEEALELFPEQAEKIEKLEEAYKKENLIELDDESQDEFDSMILAGDIDGIFENYDKYSKRLPESVRRLNWKEQKEVAAILKNDAFIEEYHYLTKKQAKEDAMKQALNGNTLHKTDRVMAALFSLGLTELTYNYTYFMDFSGDVSSTKRKKIEAITDLIDMIISRREENNKNIKDREVQILSSEKKKSDIKDEINKVLLYPIEKYKENKAVFVPNSIMLQGDNPHIMKDIISSMSTKPFVNFVSVPSKRNYDEMQDDIFDQLELAEKNYQETKERSIIFVNGMEKLLNPKLNSAGNIACMKDILSCASEDYHSTIVFYSQNPEKLDKGSLMTHRVAYKIDVPFSAVGVKD